MLGLGLGLGLGLKLVRVTVLLGQVDRELVQDLARVAGQGPEERPVTVHDDETELVVRLEQLLQRLVRGRGRATGRARGSTTAVGGRESVGRGASAQGGKKKEWTGGGAGGGGGGAWRWCAPLGGGRRRTSVWNLLSHRYREVLIGLNGSKSMFTFFSLLSSVKMVPQ